MREVVLASKSIARQELLKQIGLKFRVAKTRVKEKRRLANGCGNLVIENALQKALEVACQLTSGVVIGADTVVLVEGKIIGKPKNTKDAFNTIKLLSKKPQWVYTGLVVIDVDRKAIFKAYEKTKVFLRALSDREIKGYLKKVYALDKAGSFDIQGIGGIFTKRIEGCFYNVVGLPLMKLAELLRKADIELL